MEKVWHILFRIAVPTKRSLVRSIMVVAALLCACNGDHRSPDTFAAKFVRAIPQIPPTRQLRITLAPGTFTTLDFMALHGCALQITLGKYQSRLGQFASDSQRLLLDLEYLRIAPACIALKKREHRFALAERLQQENKLKLQQLPSRIFNAIMTNIEFQQFWNRRYKCCDNVVQSQLTLSAIANINRSTQRWLSGDYRASNIEFEIQLNEIAKGSSMYMQSEVLRESLSLLEAQLDPVLPPEYLSWRVLRNTVLRDLHRERGL